MHGVHEQYEFPGPITCAHDFRCSKKEVSLNIWLNDI